MHKSSGASPEAVSLPKGSGSVQGIGESFQPDLFTGTGNYPVPLWFPPGPGKLRPEMSLAYSTGAGNGPFGMGWRLGALSIRRRTERGLPTYDDAKDTFLLDTAELAPLGGGRYRVRFETGFFRVERQGLGWEVRDRGGRRFLLGETPDSRIETTGDGPPRVAAWLLSRVVDPNGNEIRYAYEADRGQRYLASITYGIYRVVFHYEDREDVLTDRRYGFDVVTGRRGVAVTYHLRDAATPFCRYDLSYENCPYSRLSLLREVVYRGEQDGVGAQLPPLRFTYAPFTPGRRYQPYRSATGGPPPLGLADPDFDLVDLFGAGRPGVVELRDSVKRYWPNQGNGEWGPPRTLDRLPAPVALSDEAVAIADLNGDGAADLLVLSEHPLGYYRNEAGQGWRQHTRFRRAPRFDPRDGEARLVDLDGDGITDLLRAAPEAFYLYYNLGDEGWASPVQVPRRHDQRHFPDVSLADPRVKFADMTGDGLLDLAYVHDGRIDYWPHYGRGRFGDRVTLRWPNPVVRTFDPNRLFLSDINGNGLADVIYVDRECVYLWVNRCGTGLHPLPPVRHTPLTENDNVALVDMNGTGTAGVLWSFPRDRQHRDNYKYLDFTGGARPYLLTAVENGLGLRTEISYGFSPDQARAATLRGEPWQSTLPFPVAVVTGLVQRDLITGGAVTKNIRYHDGFFDGRERLFRGFGRVELEEAGDEEAPTTLTVSWFHQGRRGLTPGDTPDRRNALAGRLFRLEVFDTGQPDRPLRTEENDYAVQAPAVDSRGRDILFAHLQTSTVRIFEQSPQPVVSTTRFTYDSFGNVTEKRETWDSGAATQTLVSRMRYTVDTVAWLLNLPAERAEYDAGGALLSLERFFYDGPAFTGLPLTQATHGNVRRHERLVFSDALTASVYGADTPDLTALGYHRIASPDGQQGWAIDEVRYDHHPDGRVLHRQDADGGITELLYGDDRLYLTAIRNPLNHLTELTYDERFGKLSRITEPNGQETRYQFDPVGRLAAVIKPGDSEGLPTVSFHYLEAGFPLGLLTRTRQQSGQADTLDQAEYFDGSGQLLQKRVAAGGGQVVVDGWRQFNARGWEAERGSPFFSAGLAYVAGEGQHPPHPYRFRHDALGRVVEAITPDGRPSRTVYQPGVIIRYDVADTDDSPENQARGYHDTPRYERFDAKGNLLEVEDLAGPGQPQITHYQYDARSLLTSITDARGVMLATYRYDALSRRIAVVHADAGTRRQAPHPNGQPALLLDAAGHRTLLRYDALGRKREVEVDGVIVERYTYDGGGGQHLIGRLARLEDEAGELTFSYTPRGQLARKTRRVETLAGLRTMSVQYLYDAMERMTGITYPDGSAVSFHYDARGHVSRIDGVVDAITYDALGRATRIDYANQVRDSFTFDPRTFFLTSLRTDGPGRPAPYTHLTYEYDPVGNPLHITDHVTEAGHPAFQRQFRYDALYQLTEASGTLDGTPFRQQCQYDDAGNFLRNEAFRPEDLTVAAGSNRLRGALTAGGEQVLFDYDANGNTTTLPGRTLRYDARQRLIRVEKAGGVVVEYRYGADGERVRRRVTSGGVTRETLFFDNLYEEESGESPRRHVFFGETRVATLTGAAGRLIYHRDGSRNVILVTGSAGEIVRELGYFPFGAPAYSVGAGDSAYQFMGEAYDPDAGLVYALSRYYDPLLGRFLTPDLYSVLHPDKLLGMPRHLNPYLYAGNNPMRFIDNEGAWWKWLVGALIIAALIVATVVVGVFTGGAGFAFGILLAASIGSAFGAGIGVYSAATSGGDLADGFLFGAIVGGAAGAAGYAAGALVGAAGISGAWGAILAGAAQGAVLGAANGAIAGYAGGAGSIQDIFTQAAIGFVVGAVVGGALGYLTHSTPTVAGTTEKALSTGTATGQGPMGQPISQSYSTGLGGVGRAIGGVWEPAAQSALNALATPVGVNVGITVATGVAGFGHAAIYHDWDEIRAWLLEITGKDEIIVNGPSANW